MEATLATSPEAEAVTQASFPFVFLGTALKANQHNLGIDVLGLASVINLPFYPQTLSGLFCIFGIHKSLFRDGFTCQIRLTDEQRPEHTATVNNFAVKVKELAQNDRGEFVFGESSQIAFTFTNDVSEGSTYQIVYNPCPPLMVTEPTVVRTEIIHDGQTYLIGKTAFNFAQTPPLTQDERRALASRPNATTGVVLTLGCASCHEKSSVYMLLDPAVELSAKFKETMIATQATDIATAPDIWQCGCQKAKLPLTFLKLGLHDIFRHPDKPSGNVIRACYDQGIVERLMSEYYSLLSSNPREELVQKFLEDHHMFWSFLSPKRIIPKPPLMTPHKADFAILSSNNILYFVEIEKPATKLYKKTNKAKQHEVHSELHHAFEQVRDWDSMIDTDRAGVLRCLEIASDDVHDIRYIVIAGMLNKAPFDIRKKLRRNPDTAKTDFYCFDELTFPLHSFAAKLV